MLQSLDSSDTAVLPTSRARSRLGRYAVLGMHAFENSMCDSASSDRFDEGEQAPCETRLCGRTPCFLSPRNLKCLRGERGVVSNVCVRTRRELLELHHCGTSLRYRLEKAQEIKRPKKQLREAGIKVDEI